MTRSRQWPPQPDPQSRDSPVGEPRRHTHKLGASSKERPGTMRIEGLHVNRPTPSRAHDLGQPFGVVLVSLIELHLQSGLHPPGIKTRDIEAGGA